MINKHLSLNLYNNSIQEYLLRNDYNVLKILIFVKLNILVERKIVQSLNLVEISNTCYKSFDQNRFFMIIKFIKTKHSMLKIIDLMNFELSFFTLKKV